MQGEGVHDEGVHDEGVHDEGERVKDKRVHYERVHAVPGCRRGDRTQMMQYFGPRLQWEVMQEPAEWGPCRSLPEHITHTGTPGSPLPALL